MKKYFLYILAILIATAPAKLQADSSYNQGLGRGAFFVAIGAVVIGAWWKSSVDADHEEAIEKIKKSCDTEVEKNNVQPIADLVVLHNALSDKHSKIFELVNAHSHHGQLISIGIEQIARTVRPYDPYVDELGQDVNQLDKAINTVAYKVKDWQGNSNDVVRYGNSINQGQNAIKIGTGVSVNLARMRAMLTAVRHPVIAQQACDTHEKNYQQELTLYQESQRRPHDASIEKKMMQIVVSRLTKAHTEFKYLAASAVLENNIQEIRMIRNSLGNYDDASYLRRCQLLEILENTMVFAKKAIDNSNEFREDQERRHQHGIDCKNAESNRVKAQAAADEAEAHKRKADAAEQANNLQKETNRLERIKRDQEAEELRHGYKQTIAILRGTVANFEKMIINLRTNITAHEATIRNLRSDRDNINRECIRVTERRDDLQAQVNSLRDELTRVRNAANNDQAKLQQVKDIITRLETNPPCNPESDDYRDYIKPIIDEFRKVLLRAN